VENKPKLTPANIVILAAGAVVLIGSFLDFYKATTITVEGINIRASFSANAWSSSTNLLLFPLTTLIVLFAVLMAAHVAVTAFAANVSLPDRVLGFTWDQIHLVLAVQATIMMIAYLIRNKGGLDFGIGFWLMLLGAIGLLVGAILRTREPAGAPPFA
jgi:hypothetical protein